MKIVTRKRCIISSLLALSAAILLWCVGEITWDFVFCSLVVIVMFAGASTDYYNDHHDAGHHTG